MMSRARELEAVSLSLPYIAGVPELQRLRHLVLEAHKSVGQELFVNLCQDASCTPNLETLHLSMSTVLAERCQFRTCVSRQESLCLDRLQKLRHVTLLRLLPGKLVLPEGCGLTLLGYLEVASRVWQEGWHESAIGQHLRMLQVIPREMFHQLRALRNVEDWGAPLGVSAKLQSLLSAFCPRLTHLSLTCAHFGSADAPLLLGDSMPALQCLQLTASQGMHVSFPASVQLRVLNISCVAGPSSLMSLQFADVTAFVAELTALRVAFCTSHGMGLANLLDALIERGLLPLSMDQGGYFTQSFPQEGSAALAMRNALWTGAPPNPDAGWSPYACQCQACDWCLRRAGVLSTL